MLGSGSGGNSAVVSCDGEHVVVDAGFGSRTLASRLRAAGVPPAAVAACVLTHEHGDHVRGAARVAVRWRWPLFATAGTAATTPLARTPIRRVATGATIEFERMSVRTIATPHDAAESIGVVFTEIRTGARIAIFNDLGHVTDAIRDACRGVDVLVIESNHDDAMLRFGPYPRWLQARIASNVGHLSNRSAAALLTQTVSPDVTHVVLAHLSQQCNTPKVALSAAGAVLRRARYRGSLTAARPDAVDGPFQAGRSHADRPLQLSLL